MTITAPPNGSVFDEGTAINFAGTATDPEDGDLTASLSWSSSLDGPIGSGGSFSTSTLSVGTHVITASVTDSGGLPGSDSITVTVNAVGGTTEVTFVSIAAEDGWIRESSETSGLGGRSNSTNSGTASLRAGDDSRDRQYLSIVSFDTSSIPDGATIVSATLRLRRGTVAGTNPFLTHGACLVDIRTGGFGGNVALANSDFQADATAAAVASLSNAASNGAFSQGDLNAAGLNAINKTGKTQFRVRFALDDNDDRGTDYIGYYAADNGTEANRPVLIVVYQ